MFLFFNKKIVSRNLYVHFCAVVGNSVGSNPVGGFGIFRGFGWVHSSILVDEHDEFGRVRSSVFPHLGLAQCSKIGKKCNFKSTKTHFFNFTNGKKKIIFCTRKKFKIAFLVLLNFFLVQKLIFLPFLKLQKMCFCTFKIALFSNFRAM